jgi:hypothetical protein
VLFDAESIILDLSLRCGFNYLRVVLFDDGFDYPRLVLFNAKSIILNLFSSMRIRLYSTCALQCVGRLASPSCSSLWKSICFDLCSSMRNRLSSTCALQMRSRLSSTCALQMRSRLSSTCALQCEVDYPRLVRFDDGVDYAMQFDTAPHH